MKQLFYAVNNSDAQNVYCVLNKSLRAQCFLHVDNDDSDETALMPRLIRVITNNNGHFVC